MPANAPNAGSTSYSAAPASSSRAATVYGRKTSLTSARTADIKLCANSNRTTKTIADVEAAVRSSSEAEEDSAVAEVLVEAASEEAWEAEEAPDQDSDAILRTALNLLTL